MKHCLSLLNTSATLTQGNKSRHENDRPERRIVQSPGAVIEPHRRQYGQQQVPERLQTATGRDSTPDARPNAIIASGTEKSATIDFTGALR